MQHFQQKKTALRGLATGAVLSLAATGATADISADVGASLGGADIGASADIGGGGLGAEASVGGSHSGSTSGTGADASVGLGGTGADVSVGTTGSSSRTATVDADLGVGSGTGMGTGKSLGGSVLVASDIDMTTVSSMLSTGGMNSASLTATLGSQAEARSRMQQQIAGDAALSARLDAQGYSSTDVLGVVPCGTMGGYCLLLDDRS